MVSLSNHDRPFTLRRAQGERLLKLVIAYDGTHFAGWQRQKSARTVQAILEEAFHRILNQKVHVAGAGRTDSGVHAQGQAAHVAAHSRMSLPSLRRALNAVLPEDLLILSVRAAPPGFHAQYSAKGKLYRYAIWNQPLRPLFDRNRVFHVPIPLDLKAMQQAARLLKGRHDFRAFHSSGRSVASTVRTLRLLSVRRREGKIVIGAEADGFLYHMVRRMVGLLVEIGKGKYPPDVARSVLLRRSPVVPPTAPAKGLCLMKVRYR